MYFDRRFILTALAATVVALAAPAAAQVAPQPLQPLTMTSQPGPRQFRVERQGVFNKTKVRYDVELVETIVKDGAGKPSASLLSTAYVAKDVADPSRRPVIFAFNGGPGGAAEFLRFGALGPKIFPSGKPNTPLADNPLSPLDAADLVFLDPPETGYSRTLPGGNPDRYYSIDGDSEVMSQAVVDWLRAHHRLSSPVYLLGESYGTMRAVAMARDLAREPEKIEVAGLMLAGNSLGYGQKGQMPDILFTANALPMMASVAWNYGKIDNKGQTWTQAVDKARRFARTTYIDALMQGYELDDATREAVVRQLPALIGIPERYFREHHTIVVKDFLSELLRDRGLVVDGNNGRETHPAGGDHDRSNPFPAWGRAMDAYVADDLRISGMPPYIPADMTLNPKWNYYTAGAMALDVTLAKAMRDNPKLRVMLVQGRYDTLTTIGNSEYIMRQADLDRSRYSIAYYDAGHNLAPQPEILNAIHGFVEAR